MILANPSGTSYRFLVEDVVLVHVDCAGNAFVYLRGMGGNGCIACTPEQLAQVQEALDRL